MLRYALTIFVSAFLLFQVQPLISKYILPWFGGTPSVWTTCVLFFQVLLLGGYAYAHVVATRLRQRHQVALHLVVVAAAVALLPIAPSGQWKPQSAADPTWRILALLAACVGMPYFVLATTSPLLQAWFSRTHPGRSPYRLFALSNLGSLLALLSFPFVVEPALPSPTQARAWSVAFAAFAALCAYCAVRTWRATQAWEASPAPGSTCEGDVAPAAPRPGLVRRLLWLVLPACASVLLLAVTNQMCQDVAVVPFLWVLPLSLYLISFIICFDNERWYIRLVFWLWMGGGIGAMAALLHLGVDASIQWQVGGHSLALFGCCMVCHGELVRLKPSPRYLTSFYLMVSAGGALGGVFVTLVAPRIFRNYFELHYGMVACCALAMVALWVDKRPLRHWPRRWRVGLAVPLAVLAPLGLLAVEPSGKLGPFHDAWAARVASCLWVEGTVVLIVLGAAGRSLRRWRVRLGLPLFLVAPLAVLWLAQSQRINTLTSAWPEWVARARSYLTVDAVLAAWAVLAAGLFALWVGRAERRQPRAAWLWALGVPAYGLAVVFLGQRLHAEAKEAFTGTVAIARNFYGVLQVGEYYRDYPHRHQYILSHGRINHGAQLRSAEGRRRPITYFAEDTGIGLLFVHYPRPASGLRVGIVGLGVGTTAAYGEPGDHFRFYEINPQIRQFATTLFTYLADSQADCRVVLGDGRLSLERELRRGERQRFDILCLDAFSGDAPPVHLLTREAFEIYLAHLKPDGVICVNTANRYVDLQPVCRAIGEHFGLRSVRIDTYGDDEQDTYGTSYVLLSRNRQFLDHEAIADAAAQTEDSPRSPILWTDSYSNLFRVLK